LAQGTRPTATPQASFAQPGISPDGSEIAFVSAGDIWVVPARGGDARLLIAHAASEERPLYSPDGARLAFMSNRNGSMDIFVLTLSTGQIARLTFDDGLEQLDAWSRDGEWIYFSWSDDVYRVRARGGTPMPVSADRDLPEHSVAPAPDGTSLTVVARGGFFGWPRKGRSHLDESELWRVRFDGGEAPRYEQITTRGAKQQWPMYSNDGASLYFVSDRTGPQNLWMKPARGEARAVTSFSNGRVMWPSMALNGQIAFERDFGIWMYEPSSRRAHEVPIALRGAALVDPVEHLALTTGFSSLAVSPDAQKMAFVARGEVFAASAADGGDAMRVTRTPAAEDQLAWSGDSRRVVYAANRTGSWQLFMYDFSTNQEAPLTSGTKNANLPQFSPDGKSIAFIRDSTELCVVAVESRDVRVLARGFFGRPPRMADRPIAWSPDSRWIAYLSAGSRMFQNAWVVPVTGGEARQVSWLSDTFAFPNNNTLSWSTDGSLFFNTGARFEPAQLVRIDLVARTPRFREDRFTALFRDEGPKQPPAVSAALTSTSQSAAIQGEGSAREVRIDFEGIGRRLTVIPIGLDVGPHALSPDGTTVVVTATVAGQQNFFSYSLDDLAAEPPVARQLTTTAPQKTALQFAADGKSIWYLEGGRPTTTTIEPRVTRSPAVRAELDVDFATEKWEVFHQAWEFLNENFYDASFHGVDWNDVRATYAPRIAGARTPGEMRRILDLMVGEMNSSHMGIGTPPPFPSPVVGRLGLDFDRVLYETRGEFRVTSVVPLGPAAVAGNVRVGDVVLDVDGTPLGASTNLSALLAHKIGRKVTLTVGADASGQDRRTVSLLPVVGFSENQLRYRAAVDAMRALVSRLSGGRLGYVHIQAMSPATLVQLYLDLDAETQEKEGIVIDIRNNGGGATNGHVLDVLMRKPYIDMVQRGMPSVSGRYILGQRAVQVPTILVTNQRSVSDAENFTEGYRVLGLGRVVGEPTAGADIYTGFGTMVDGTGVRLPFMRNAQLDQAALELVPRKVDVLVNRPLGESYGGRDSQLEVAVRELLAQLESTRNRARTNAR
jgi:Tol biopolymer transport system component/C-terminal processing protease CtpA/Prc